MRGLVDGYLKIAREHADTPDLCGWCGSTVTGGPVPNTLGVADPITHEWRCPVCDRVEYTGGDVVHRQCQCLAHNDPPRLT